MPICMEEMFSPGEMESRSSEKGLRLVHVLTLSVDISSDDLYCNIEFSRKQPYGTEI